MMEDEGKGFVFDMGGANQEGDFSVGAWSTAEPSSSSDEAGPGATSGGESSSDEEGSARPRQVKKGLFILELYLLISVEASLLKPVTPIQHGMSCEFASS